MKKHLTFIGATLLMLVSLCFVQGKEKKETTLATTSNKALEEKIVLLEKQGWEAIKKKDWNTLSRLMTDDFVDVGNAGIRGKPETVEDLKANLILTDYSMENIRAVELNKTAAMVAYKLTQKGTYKGETVPSTSYCSATYVQRGGEWLNTSFHETPAK